MHNFYEIICVNKELQSVIFEPVCTKYDISFAEIMILLFLKNNTAHNTAKDIVREMKLKSLLQM